MEAIMSGAATNAQIAAFLTALRMKGETVEELIGFAQVMRQKAVRVRTRSAEAPPSLTGTDREMLIDTCGTGGDASGTFNVSTATAFVVAGRRPQGRQARQPLGLEPLRLRRRGRGARREPRADAAAGRALRRRGRHRLPLRAAPAHRDEARDGGAARDGHPHRLQPARAAHEPRERQRAGDRRRRRRRSPSRSRACWRSSAPCARSWCTAPTGSTRSRTPARAGSPRCARASCASTRCGRKTSGCRARRSRELQGGDRQQNAQIIRDLLGREPGPRRDIVLMNAVRRARGGRPREHAQARAWSSRRSRSTPAPRASGSSAWSVQPEARRRQELDKRARRHSFIRRVARLARCAVEWRSAAASVVDLPCLRRAAEFGRIRTRELAVMDGQGQARGARMIKARVPRYQGIADDLRAQHPARRRSRRGAARHPAPAREATFGVTLMTLRQALEVLEREKLIERRHGLGTFVAAPSIDYDILQLRRFAGDLSAQGEHVTTRLLGSRFVGGERRVTAALGLARGARAARRRAAPARRRPPAEPAALVPARAARRRGRCARISR